MRSDIAINGDIEKLIKRLETTYGEGKFKEIICGVLDEKIKHAMIKETSLCFDHLSGTELMRVRQIIDQGEKNGTKGKDENPKGGERKSKGRKRGKSGGTLNGGKSPSKGTRISFPAEETQVEI